MPLCLAAFFLLGRTSPGNPSLTRLPQVAAKMATAEETEEAEREAKMVEVIRKLPLLQSQAVDYVFGSFFHVQPVTPRRMWKQDALKDLERIRSALPSACAALEHLENSKHQAEPTVITVHLLISVHFPLCNHHCKPSCHCPHHFDSSMLVSMLVQPSLMLPPPSMLSPLPTPPSSSLLLHVPLQPPGALSVHHRLVPTTHPPSLMHSDGFCPPSLFKRAFSLSPLIPVAFHISSAVGGMIPFAMLYLFCHKRSSPPSVVSSL